VFAAVLDLGAFQEIIEPTHAVPSIAIALEHNTMTAGLVRFTVEIRQ
jgi:hypothetical protein